MSSTHGLQSKPWFEPQPAHQGVLGVVIACVVLWMLVTVVGEITATGLGIGLALIITHTESIVRLGHHSLTRLASAPWMSLGIFLLAGLSLRLFTHPDRFAISMGNRQSDSSTNSPQPRPLADPSLYQLGLDPSALFVLLDRHGQILDASDRFCQLSQYSLGELLGQPRSRLFAPTVPPETWTDLGQTLHQGQVWQGEILQQAKDGSFYGLKLTILPVAGEAGSPRHYLEIGVEQRSSSLETTASGTVAPEPDDHLNLALQTAALGTWEWDILNDRVIWLNGSEQMFGLQPGEFTGTYSGFLAVLHPDDRDYVNQTVQAALAEQMTYQTEFRVVWKDQSLHWILATGQFICDQTGRKVRMVGSHLDITERKQAELTLQQQTEHQRLMTLITQRIRQSLDLQAVLTTTVEEVKTFLQADRVIIYRFNADGSGQIVVEALAWGQMSLQGWQQLEPFEPQSLALYQQGTMRVVADLEQEEMPLERRVLWQTLQVRAFITVPILQGKQLWGLLSAHQCHQPRSWQPYETDLLQHLASQLAIAIQQSELYQQVQRLNSNLEQQVQERTTQLQQALGFEAVLKRITDKVRDSLDETQILRSAVRELALSLHVGSCHATRYNLEEGTATICYEYCNFLPSTQGQSLQITNFPEIYDRLLAGHWLHMCSLAPNPIQGQVSMLACPIVDDQGVLGDLWLLHRREYAFNNLEIRLLHQVANQCAIALRQARLYQTSQAQVEELEKLNRLKDDFLSTVSHELRTPVSNMKMAIRMLELSLQRSNPFNGQTNNKAAQYLQILSNECEREISLINDLLDLQRLEAGERQLLANMIEIPLWLPELAKPFVERARARQQQLDLEIPSPLPAFLCDSYCLERIVAELLSNACKYTPPGERIVVTANANTEVMKISVVNYGAEIPATELPRIFSKFYRVPSADPWKQGGTGLGLALVQKLTEHLGADLSVESSQNRTVFTLTVPRMSISSNREEGTKE